MKRGRSEALLELEVPAPEGNEQTPSRTKPTMDRSTMPTSALLARVQAFIPQMAAANRSLVERVAREGAAAVDIEAVGEGEPHIEMNLGLGVMEAQLELTEETLVLPGQDQAADTDEDAPLAPVTDTPPPPSRPAARAQRSRPRLIEEIPSPAGAAAAPGPGVAPAAS